MKVDRVEFDSKETSQKFFMAYNALHVFVYKSHLTFRVIFWYKKNATYTRINTVGLLVLVVVLLQSGYCTLLTL